MKNSVSKVVARDLCCGCGACSQVCSSKAINIAFDKGLFKPFVNDVLCVGCGQCVKVCPSSEVDVQSVYENNELFSNEEQDCFIAFSKNEMLRHQGTSGGVVSTIISELLRKKVFEKAYVLSYENFNNEQARIKAITNPDDIIGAAKSKYIPASISEVIKDIKSELIGKAIVVATPCQLLAVKNYLALNSVSDSNILFIGLFCDKTLNYNIYNYYSFKYGDYDSLHFRDKEGNGWPGDTVLLKKGEKRIVNARVRMSLKPYFQLNRCRYCFDKLNQLADISCGDCYIDGEQSKEGKSSIVVRTEKGHLAIDECATVLDLKKSSLKAIKMSQHLDLKLRNYYRNNSPKGVFILPSSSEKTVTPSSDTNEDCGFLKLNLGAKAITKSDFCAIDDLIKKEKPQKDCGKIMRYGKRFMSLFGPSHQTKNVFLDHAGFVNKGAELMLQSVVRQLNVNMPEVRVIVPQSVFYENLNYCHQHNILPLKLNDSWKKKMVKGFIYGKVLNKPWYITPDQIDVVLDAGGFQFGDQWKTNEKDIQEIDKYYSSFTKKNRKIIFLPQAFGPFEERLSKQQMSEVYEIADLIYAREQVSYQYLKALFSDGNKIKQAPDFTCLCDPGETKSISIPKDYVVLVPNMKMITHTNDAIATDYYNFLYGVSRFLLDRGEFLVLLNHEGPNDRKLLMELNQKLSGKALVISDLDALEVKSIIGGAKLLISSRFHGVVSGLTQGVPTLCTSWSHKYLELLKEHCCDNNLLSINNLDRDCDLITDALENPLKYSSQEGCTDEIRKKASEMWSDVFSLINA